MIFYFTGTGNSKYVAEVINKIVDDEIISMNKIMKERKRRRFKSEKPLVFVCPTYAWRIPRVVENFIEGSNFSGNKDVYFVMTCGDSAGNAVKYIEKLCIRKGLNFMGLSEIKMPENYIALFEVPEKIEANRIINRSKSDMIRTGEIIKSGGELKNYGKKGKFLSKFINPLFYPFIVSSKGFRVEDNCISCGKCKRICPLNNIEMENKKPVWGNRCTHCMACINICPTEAIEYKESSVGKPRHFIDFEGSSK